MPTEYMVYLSLPVELEQPSRSDARLYRQLAERIAAILPGVVADMAQDGACHVLIDRVEVLRSTPTKRKGA